MNINKNRVIKFVVILMSAVALVAMSPLFARANNYKDDPWSFTVGEYGNTGLIVKEGRDKMDASSSYIKCNNYYGLQDSKGTSFQATAYGSNSKISGFINCVYNGKSSIAYTVTGGSEYRMVNYIYEAGYSYGNIYYNASFNRNITFVGVWSPDSI
ncbi:MAG: hypothetical protein K1W00_00410 [Lachnospiraceae bacterium]